MAPTKASIVIRPSKTSTVTFPQFACPTLAPSHRHQFQHLVHHSHNLTKPQGCKQWPASWLCLECTLTSARQFFPADHDHLRGLMLFFSSMFLSESAWLFLRPRLSIHHHQKRHVPNTKSAVLNDAYLIRKCAEMVFCALSTAFSKAVATRKVKGTIWEIFHSIAFYTHLKSNTSRWKGTNLRF